MTYQKSPEQLQDEIAQTRARMDARLSELTEQASPTTVVAKLINVETSSSGDLVGVLVDRVKANPLAALTIGAGLLGISRTDDSGSRNPHDQHGADEADFVAESPARRLREHSVSLRADAEAAVDNAKHLASKQAHNVADKASQLSDDAKARLDDLQSSARELTDQVSRRAREMPQKAKYEAEYAAAWVKENPVPASLMALAAGAAIASFLAPKKSTASPIRDNRALVPEEDELTVEKAAARKRKTQKPAAKKQTTTTKPPRKPRAVKPVAATAKAPVRTTINSPTAKPLDDMFTDK